MISRAPTAALRPFIEILWASDDDDVARGAAAPRERVLPTGSMHVVVRLDTPLHLYADDDDRVGTRIAHAVVGGARDSYYVRDVSSASRSVGAQLRPGAAAWLLGAPAGPLAARHTPLESLWGGSVRALTDQLAATPRAARRLAIFEAFLLQRLSRTRDIDPAIAAALGALHVNRPVGELVRQSGWSHRRFVSAFHEAVGLTPKVYGRVVRFRHALAHLASPLVSARPPLAQLSLAAGYSDQSHFQREFRVMSGLSPGLYRKLQLESPHHVPAMELRSGGRARGQACAPTISFKTRS